MKIAVLVSGGVDSAVVVDKLYKEGHDLHLFYIRIGTDNGEGDCSAEEDIELCTLIAHKYGLPLDIVPLHEEYWDNVMKYALDTVKAGLTPHPDMMCNKIIKFGYFEERVGCKFDKTATGHYARVEERDGIYYLGTAADPVKDQTDFLARISQKQLSHLLFPLGDLPKKEVRRIAEEAGLPNAGRKDSQGICFLGKINYNDFLRRQLGTRKGPVIEIETGRKIGEHEGYWFHTIGQRKGLNMSGGPWYVVRKNVRDNAVYVSHGFEAEKSYGNLFEVGEMHWLSVDPFQHPEVLGAAQADSELTGTHPHIRITFKNRHNPRFTEGILTRQPDGETYRVESADEIQGIAPGQFAIIYTPDKRYCLGSAVINRQLNRRHKNRKDAPHPADPADGNCTREA